MHFGRGLVVTSHQASEKSTEGHDAILLTLRNQEARIAKLEKSSPRTLFERLTASATASALFLGLVLTAASLYDAIVAKPRADRISALGRFNDAVNSAAKVSQDLAVQMQTNNAQLQLAVMSQAAPQILNDISTAKALLRELNNDDVGIPQLIVLISGAFTAGDLDSVKEFADRGVKLTNVTPYLHAEAERYEGKYLFASGDPTKGRAAYEAAVSALGTSSAFAAERAFILADLVLEEYTSGDCQTAAADLQDLAAALKLPQVTPQARAQVGQTTKAQLLQLQDQHCPAPQALDVLFPDSSRRIHFKNIRNPRSSASH
jgi:hypothetical protein